MIARDGIGAVTARAVAREAGVSLGTVSHHFSSLELLLVATLEHGAGRVIGELERLALDLQAADWDTEQWANALAAALDDSISAHPEAHIACFEMRLLAIRRPELRVAADEILRAYLRLGRLVLQAVGASDPGERAIRLVAMVTGLVLAELGLPAQGRLQRLRRALGAEVATLAV